MNRDLTIIVLAAGEGTRMKSEIPKILHPLCGRSMIEWVLDAAGSLGPARRRLAVVGHGHEEVSAVLARRGWEPVHQKERLGTGHAVLCALHRLGRRDGEVLVLNGDTPLLTAATLRNLLRRHRRTQGPMTMLTARLPDPSGYGRVRRDPSGRVEAIVEQKELAKGGGATDEINAGVYVFGTAFLREHLPRLKRHRKSGEYYLTDLAAAACRAGAPAEGVVLEEPAEAFGVNDRRQLAAAGAILRERILDGLMKRGVTFADPATAYIDKDATVGRNTVIMPGVVIQGKTRVGRGCRLGPWVRISSSFIGDEAVVKDGSVVEDSVVRRRASIGPMAHLRPGTVVGEGAKVGNFVEVKKSFLAAGVKASHLSYLGDAVVGRGANVGAGTITCNYDGVEKHRTMIGEGAFIGSDVMLVAPVRIGKGAVVGAGSTIVRDVPPGALALSRAPQTVKPGWAARRSARRKGKGE